MSALDPVGPAPETREPRFLWLLLGCSAAPLFWLGQVMLGYGVTAYICYPGDHPIRPASTASLFAVLMLFDLIAMAACAIGAIMSWRAWRHVRPGESRNRFLALWGLMSSLWFFAAILFNTIVSLMVPPCLV
jgi:hypothetical protein